MTGNEIPKFNSSLKAFTFVIRACAIIGISLALVGTIWLVAVARGGLISDLWFPLLLAYTGQGLIGLAIAGALLRHTAKTVVDGLGGSISVSADSSVVPVFYDLQPDLEEKALAEKLKHRDWVLWKEAGEPSLKAFAASGNQNFQDWLRRQ
jgi:hypothetical protein